MMRIFSVLVLVFLTSVSAGKPNITPGLYNNAEGSPLISLINSAQSTLDMEFYEMDDPNVISAVRQAISRGVTVHIVKEPKPVGATCKVFENIAGQEPKAPLGKGASCEDQTALVAEVNKSGGSYQPFVKEEFCPEGTLGCLEHGKVIVVDSQYSLVSSGNFNTSSLCDIEFSPDKCNRDYSYVSKDPVIVKSLQNIIEKDLIGKSYDIPSALLPGAGEKITVGPNSLEPIVTFIKSAKQSLQVENQYLKDPTINDALIEVAQRGVKVEIVLASACSFGYPKDNEAKKLTAIFSAFDAAGIQTKMFNKNIKVNDHAGYMHAKAIVVDNKKAWMGSVNGSTQAATKNREFGVFFSDSANVQKLARTMKSDFQDPNEESWEDSLHCAENGRSQH